MRLGRIVLAPVERKELERRARSRSLATELVKRAKVILMLAPGHSYSEISEELTCRIVTSACGSSALSKSGWLGWIPAIVAPSTDGEPRGLRRASWN